MLLYRIWRDELHTADADGVMQDGRQFRLTFQGHHLGSNRREDRARYNPIHWHVPQDVDNRLFMATRAEYEYISSQIDALRQLLVQRLEERKAIERALERMLRRGQSALDILPRSQ